MKNFTKTKIPVEVGELLKQVEAGLSPCPG